MVNVNTQVSSSMELPFGEYTLMFLSTCVGGFSEKRSSVAAACFFLSFLCFRAAAAWLLSSAGSQLILSGNITAICIWLFHTAVIQEVCQRYGGC